MESIIQQIAIELVEKINKKAFSEELSDLDRLAADIFEDYTHANTIEGYKKGVS